MLGAFKWSSTRVGWGTKAGTRAGSCDTGYARGLRDTRSRPGECRRGAGPASMARQKFRTISNPRLAARRYLEPVGANGRLLPSFTARQTSESAALDLATHNGTVAETGLPGRRG